VNRRQKLIVIETAAGFVSIMLYIWRLRFTAPRAWIFILGFFVLSHVLRRERTASLGLRWGNFQECVETLAPALLLIALSLMTAGVLLETIRPISPEYGFMCLLAYCPWGIFQQYLLNGYIANRLLAVSSARYVPVMAAALFAAAHLPNWFLMAVTFVTGYVSAKIFMRYRNLYFLGLAHALIGTVLFVVIPDSISHHLTVGPGFFRGARSQRAVGGRVGAPRFEQQNNHLNAGAVYEPNVTIRAHRHIVHHKRRIGNGRYVPNGRTPRGGDAAHLVRRVAAEV